MTIDSKVMYPATPSMWSEPQPVAELPAAAMGMYPATPRMWEGDLNAREARLRELAATGDAEAAKALAELPAAVCAALGSNPHAGDNIKVLDWVAGRFPEASQP